MLRAGMTIAIPEQDRLGGAGAIEVLLTELPTRLYRGQDWVPIEGVELEGGVVMHAWPTRIIVRVALLVELARKAQAAEAGAT